jgi:acyltransferase
LWALTCFVLVYLTFDLNKGMFTVPLYDAVVMAGSSHGNPILFPFTAIIGSIMVMLVAKITSENRLLIFLGGNALIIFGLNGAYYHFINDRLAAWLLTQHPGGHVEVLISGIVIALVSLLLTVPFIFLLNHFIPQLIGKPKLHGPLIPRLVP